MENEEILRDLPECDPQNMDTDELKFWAEKMGDRTAKKELEKRNVSTNPVY